MAFVMNEFYFSIELLTVFLLVLVAHKLFGKSGLHVWISIAAVTANIETLKAVDLFGVQATLGSIMFGSIFLATDILTELYGAKEARRSVLQSFFCSAVFLITMQITLLYQPNLIDFADAPLHELMTVNLRVTGASMLMFLIANLCDVAMYERLRQKTGGKLIWLRNNLSTITCNCLENFLFVFLGFYGLFDFNQCMEIALSTTLIEVIVSLCDTPFLYLSLR